MQCPAQSSSKLAHHDDSPVVGEQEHSQTRRLWATTATSPNAHWAPTTSIYDYRPQQSFQHIIDDPPQPGSLTPQGVQPASATVPEIEIQTTTPAVYPPPYGRSSFRTIPLPQLNIDADIFTTSVDESNASISVSSASLVPKLCAFLESVMVFSSLSCSETSIPFTSSVIEEWSRHWNEPATVPSVRRLTILHASTGQIIRVASYSEGAVTVGDIFRALEPFGIGFTPGVLRHGEGMSSDHARMRVMSNSLMLWWESSDEEVLPWNLVIGV